MPIFIPRNSKGQKELVGYSDDKEKYVVVSDTDSKSRSAIISCESSVAQVVLNDRFWQKFEPDGAHRREQVILLENEGSEEGFLFGLKADEEDGGLITVQICQNHRPDGSWKTTSTIINESIAENVVAFGGITTSGQPFVITRRVSNLKDIKVMPPNEKSGFKVVVATNPRDSLIASSALL